MLFLLKPEHRGKVEAKEVKAPEVLFVNQDDLKSTTLGDLLRQHFANSQQVETPFTGFKPGEAVPLQGTEHSECKGKRPGKDEVFGFVRASYDGEMDQLSITYPYDKTVFTKINVNDPEEYFENIKTISDGVRTIFKREYDFNVDTRLLGIKDKIKIYIDDLSKVSGPFDPGIEKAIIEEVIMNVVPKVSSLVLKPEFIADRPN